MSDEDVYWGTRLACAEMIRTGTTTFWDMYWHADAAARAVEDAGIRAVTAAPLIDDADPAKSERACADADAQPRADSRGGRRARAARVRAARHLLGQRALAALGGRARVGARRPGPDPPLRDRGRGRALRRRARRPPGRAARPRRHARPAHGPRPRLLARPGRARADRRARGDDRLEPGREPEARGRPRVPLPRGARGRRRARPRHRRPGLQQLARPARRREVLRPAAEERGPRPGRRSPPPRRCGSRPGRRRACSAAARSRPARRPTSCSSAPTIRSSRSASSTPASSTRPRARSSTRRSSPGGC